MLLEKERQRVADYGRKLSSSGLTKGTGGNISIFDEESGYMVIKPSGMAYEDIKASDVVVMDLKGNIIEGVKKPSSEHELHAMIYKMHDDARAVVHSHSMYTTTLACMGEPVVATHYLIAGAETSKVSCVKYATFGSDELAQNVKDANPKGLAMLLENHGMVAFGPTIEKAYNVAENVEWVAEIQWRAMCAGKPVVLADDEIDKVINSFKSYGQPEDNKSGY